MKTIRVPCFLWQEILVANNPPPQLAAMCLTKATAVARTNEFARVRWTRVFDDINNVVPIMK